jgi:hypothetical protein
VAAESVENFARGETKGKLIRGLILGILQPQPQAADAAGVLFSNSPESAHAQAGHPVVRQSVAVTQAFLKVENDPERFGSPPLAPFWFGGKRVRETFHRDS